MSFDTFYEKVTAGMLATITLAFIPLAFRKTRDWWRQPSERKLLADAIRTNTAEIHGIRQELRGINTNFQALSEQAQIAASISRIALNDSLIPRWETDEHGHCCWVNNALSRLFQMPVNELLGTGWTRAIVPGQQSEVSRAFKAAYASPDDYSYVHPYAIQVGDKLINVVARSVEIVRKPDGRILRMFGTVKPVETTYDSPGDLKLQESAA